MYLDLRGVVHRNVHRDDAVVISGAEYLRLRRVRLALLELVELKDGPRDGTYEKRKPRAWQEAREALDG